LRKYLAQFDMHAPPASMDSASQPQNALQRYRQRQKVRAVPNRCVSEVAQLSRPPRGHPAAGPLTLS